MSTKPLFGPWVDGDRTTFRLWAPAADRVDLLRDSPEPMQRTGDGWFERTVENAGAGMRYRFLINGETAVPDPASRFQPEDVAGPSEVVVHDHDWRTPGWTGRPWETCVFSELHVGTFTPEGTYRAAIERLDHLADTGITAIELMPLSDFPGRWNWGYDGVLPFAPDAAYGRPDDLKALIDAAHERGLMVFLDVVYNHFGPEGNYLGLYAPAFFTDAHTPWGSAIDYRLPQVRAFAIENALHWLRDYRFDGLRLDAVHAIVEPGAPSVLAEMSEAVGALARATGRHIHLVLENDDNIASWLDPLADPPQGRYRAQWNDDYHHAWHVMLTGEQFGYYRDYEAAGPLLARTLSEGFAYQGDPSRHRGGEKRGEKSAHLPATAFVNFIQNHDQIGNRALGERLTALASPEAIEAALAVTLLAPAPPLLFMGEEWGATEPFPFFCDFHGDLANAVREGRKREFAEAYAKSAAAVPDPLSEDTVKLATLDWSKRDAPPHRERLMLVRQLLKLRREAIVPHLNELVAGAAQATWQEPLLRARWTLQSGDVLVIDANLSERPVAAPSGTVMDPIWGSFNEATLAPFTVRAGWERA